MENERFHGELGLRLREARKKAGLSQAELARRAGIGRAALVAIESGSQRMTVYQLVVLAAAVGMEPTMLLPTPGDLPERLGQAMKEAGLPPEVAFWATEAVEQIKHDEDGDHEAD